MQLTKLSLLCGAMASSIGLSASPFYTFGDDAAALYLTLTASVENRSNITLDSDDEEQDIVWGVTPGFILDFGPGQTNADLSLTVQKSFLRYSDNDAFDAELLSLELDSSYSGARFDVSGNASYRENSQNTDDANPDNAVLETETIGLRVNGEYFISSKFSVGSGFGFSNVNYLDSSFNDRSVYSLPLNVYYKYSEKLDLSAGYEYTNTDVDNSTDRDQHFFNVGTRGEIFPKLLANTRVGIKYFEDDDFDSTYLGWDGNLTYLYSLKTRFTSGLSRDISAGGTGSSIERTTFSLSAIHDYSTVLSFSAFASYTLAEYETFGQIANNAGREDDIVRLGANVSYRLNEFVTLNGGYTFLNNDSEAPALVDSDTNGYTDHSIRFSASVKY